MVFAVVAGVGAVFAVGGGGKTGGEDEDGGCGVVGFVGGGGGEGGGVLGLGVSAVVGCRG